MNLNSKELFINIKEKDIPYWNDLYPYDEQDDDVKQFWENEAIKLSEGITINGVFIHPWLYWHINFWHMMLDKGDRRVPGLSQLRDNEWFFSEVLQQAERENKGVFLFGTRRFGKALLNSEILYLEDREKQIGDILVGDYIYDDSGNLVEVDGVYPQGSVMTYKVVFEDGRNVICCGEHIWRVKIGHKWIDRNLKGIMMGDYTKMYIPISKPVNYPASKLPIQPSAFGTMLSSFLCGSISEIPFDKKLCKNFLRSSIDQKKIFIESFIRAYRNVVTGEEVINITNKDIEVIRFIQKMFWSYGWYANYEDGKLILSNNRKELRIKSISMYGKHPATCITVNNSNHLFLTTNYVVTHNSAIMSSFVARNATMTYNLTHNVIGSSKEDLMNIGEYMEYGLDNIHPFLKINRTGNDWFKEVILGTKNVRNERDVHARIRITNIDQGRPSAALKPAGGTPYTTIYDEVGKYPFLAPYEAGLPSHMQNGRIRGYIFAMGCCCAGTIVYKANGEPCKIEDLKQEDGILGYDFNKGKCVSQKIEWMKPPSIKHCYRIETYRGDSRHVLECSYDHPISCSNANYRDYLYKEYVAASQLVEGDTIWVVQNNGYAYKEYVDSVVDIGEKMVYNLTASDTHTYLANDIITHNTGGNVEKSQDAQKVMNDPERYSFMVFDYDILNKKCIKPTWRISAKTACFAPGQMSHAFEKDKTTLDKYLNIEKAPGLKKIPISVTNFERSTESIDKKLESLAKGDKSSYVQYKMAYPKNVDDCFLNANVNRFPVEDALIHKSRLLEEGRPGKLVDIYQIENKKIGYRFSEKILAPYPFQGGNIDAPVIIYEDPPEEGGLFDYTYVSGCLLPGEKVLTDKGWVNVEDVDKNYSLVNKDGDFVDIIECLKYNKTNEDIYTIKVGNTLITTSFTGEHPIYVSDHITKSDHRIDESLFDFNYVKADNIKVGQWTKFPNIYRKEIDCSSKMDIFNSSIDFWWFIGFWLGNGYNGSSSKRNTISLCINELDKQSVERFKYFVENTFNLNVSCRLRKGCYEVSFNHKLLSIWIDNNFKKYSYGKFVPEWVKFLPHNYKISLIHGYLDSDGCITKHTNGYDSMEFVSVNKEMIESFHDMLLSIGIVGNVSILRKKRRSFVVSKICDQREIYHLRIGNYGCLQFKNMLLNIYPNSSMKINKISGNINKSIRHKNDCFISDDGNYVYFQIKDISISKYTGFVYNFHCETNNYVCYHISTHNCDPYKQDKSGTSSLGALYILKRHVRINDPFAYKIVASVVSRPPKIDDFCRTCEILIEAYGAKCLMENADTMFQTYLSRRNKQFVLLEEGEAVANKLVNTKARQNNKLGLAPTVPNQRMLYNLIIQYCWEDVTIGYDDDGNEIKQKGIYRIPDIELLDEIIAFGPGVNTDRIIAFAHALALAQYYDDMNYMPKSTTEKMNDENRERIRKYQVRGFTTVRHNPFKIR